MAPEALAYSGKKGRVRPHRSRWRLKAVYIYICLRCMFANEVGSQSSESWLCNRTALSFSSLTLVKLPLSYFIFISIVEGRRNFVLSNVIRPPPFGHAHCSMVARRTWRHREWWAKKAKYKITEEKKRNRVTHCFPFPTHLNMLPHLGECVRGGGVVFSGVAWW